MSNLKTCLSYLLAWFTHPKWVGEFVDWWGGRHIPLARLTMSCLTRLTLRPCTSKMRVTYNNLIILHVDNVFMHFHPVSSLAPYMTFISG